jgi:hypothetical protein
MKLSLEEFKEIITVGLDYQLAQNKGKIVFDNYDPEVEGNNIFRH